jgi:hypothetical protein
MGRQQLFATERYRPIAPFQLKQKPANDSRWPTEQGKLMGDFKALALMSRFR